MNGAYGYWIGAIGMVREVATDADLEVYERQVLKFWQEQWWA